MGISQRWRARINKKSVPAGACLLKRLGGVPICLETRDSCHKMLGATLCNPQSIKMLKKPVVTATAEHDVVAMSNDIDEE